MEIPTEGYFNKNKKNVNIRPTHIKAYNRTLRRIGKKEANRMHPNMKNWIMSQKIQGLPYNTSSSSSSNSSKRKRKTRKVKRGSKL